MQFRNYSRNMSVLMALFLILGMVQAQAAGLNVYQLTDNGKDDIDPQVFGSKVVWQGVDPNNSDWEIFVDMGKGVVQLTHNDTDDNNPRIFRSRVVWQGKDPNQGDWEIFLYRDGATVRLTDNSTDDTNPDIFGSYVVWQGWDGNDWEIFLYDGEEVTALTENDYDDCSPRISGALIVWQGGDGNDWEIFAAVLPREVTVKITPQSLNLQSKGRWIGCEISMAGGLDVRDVDTAGIRLEEVVTPAWTKVYEGSQKIKMKFDRAAVEELLEPSQAVKVTVSGTMNDGTLFEGSDTIKVLDKGNKGKGK